jgi:hypothetical protein
VLAKCALLYNDVDDGNNKNFLVVVVVVETDVEMELCATG